MDLGVSLGGLLGVRYEVGMGWGLGKGVGMTSCGVWGGRCWACS